MNNKLLMYYTKDIKKSEQIADLCKRLQIHTRKLNPSDVNVEMGKLAGIKINVGNTEQKKVPENYDMPDVMIFSGISDGVLDEFLDAYRQDKISPTPLKAVLTPYNISWTLYGLISELQRERIAVMFGKK